MSSAAAASFSADDRVYHAVAAGRSVDEVRRAIERSRSPADINQAGANGETPLRAANRLGRLDLVCLLLYSGAEGAGDSDWFWAVTRCVRHNDLAGLQRLLELGVSMNMINEHGYTPLSLACAHSRRTPNRRDLTLEIFRRSSAETRRAVDNDGISAVDDIIYEEDGDLPLRPWHTELAGELLAAGAPVQPEDASLVVPIAAVHAARREAQLAACRSMAHDWRAQENFVGVSLDMGELRAAERDVLEKRARLAALEAEMGGETDSSSSGSDSESEEGEEATGLGGDGGGA